MFSKKIKQSNRVFISVFILLFIGVCGTWYFDWVILRFIIQLLLFIFILNYTRRRKRKVNLVKILDNEVYLVSRKKEIKYNKDSLYWGEENKGYALVLKKNDERLFFLKKEEWDNNLNDLMELIDKRDLISYKTSSMSVFFEVLDFFN